MTASSPSSTGGFTKTSSGSVSLLSSDFGVHPPYFPQRSIVNEVLEKCRTSALGMVNQLLTMENKAPFTLHDPYLAGQRERYLKAYREARVPPPCDFSDGDEEPVYKDPHDQALFYMASARAYFHG